MPPQPSLCSTEMMIEAGYVRVIEPLRGALFFFLFFSPLSRPGHTDLQPPHAPSAGTSGVGRRGGCAGRIRISAVTSRRRRTDGEITLKHTRLRILVHDPPSRQPLFSAASHIWAPFRCASRCHLVLCQVQEAARQNSPPRTSSSPALVDSPPTAPSIGVPPFHQTIEHSCERRTLRPGLPSERSGQIYSERRFN